MNLLLLIALLHCFRSVFPGVRNFIAKADMIAAATYFVTVRAGEAGQHAVCCRCAFLDEIFHDAALRLG